MIIILSKPVLLRMKHQFQLTKSVLFTITSLVNLVSFLISFYFLHVLTESFNLNFRKQEESVRITEEESKERKRDKQDEKVQNERNKRESDELQRRRLEEEELRRKQEVICFHLQLSIERVRSHIRFWATPSTPVRYPNTCYLLCASYHRRSSCLDHLFFVSTSLLRLRSKIKLELM